MPEKPGFQIGRRFYPFPASFRLGDPVLVEELTGLDWHAFLDRLPDEDAPDGQEPDPVAMLGLVGVAVWQANPRWRRDRVVSYVQGLDMGDVEAVGADDDAEEDEASPPAEAEPAPGQPDSETSASSSRPESESPSAASSPTGSGTETSPT